MPKTMENPVFFLKPWGPFQLRCVFCQWLKFCGFYLTIQIQGIKITIWWKVRVWLENILDPWVVLQIFKKNTRIYMNCTVSLNEKEACLKSIPLRTSSQSDNWVALSFGVSRRVCGNPYEPAIPPKTSRMVLMSAAEGLSWRVETKADGRKWQRISLQIFLNISIICLFLVCPCKLHSKFSGVEVSDIIKNALKQSCGHQHLSPHWSKSHLHLLLNRMMRLLGEIYLQWSVCAALPLLVASYLQLLGSQNRKTTTAISP